MCDSFYHIRIIPQGHETFSTMASYENEEQVLKVIQELGAAIQRGDESFSFPTIKEINAENSLKEKITEILKRPRKSVINWKATFEDMIVSELLNLPKIFSQC